MDPHLYIVVQAESLDALVAVVNRYIGGVAWDRDEPQDGLHHSLRVHYYEPTAPPTKLDGKYIVPMTISNQEWRTFTQWEHWVPGTRTTEDV